MSKTGFGEKELIHLKNKIEGDVIDPGSSDYDKSREIWNGLFDRHPSVIVKCRNSNDVKNCINFARVRNIPLSVRSGGHDYAGKSVCEGGIVIDLSELKKIEIFPDEKCARVGAGVLIGEFDKKAQEYGLASTGATVSTVGISGFTLGGGSGYLARKHGLSVDNLLSAELITARGEEVTTNKNENPDLFWAIRGGGGNFGIITSFKFQLHPAGPEIMAGQVVYPFDQADAAIRFYHTWMANASDELTCYLFFLKVPPLDIFPAETHGKPALSFVVGHIGSADQARKEMKPLLEFGNPILEAVQSMPYTSAQTMFDEGLAKGNRWYSKAHYLESVTDDLIDVILKNTKTLPGSLSVVYLEPMGGAINRIDQNATAFPHRSAAYSIHILAGWSDADKDKSVISWSKDFFHELKPFSTGGVYVNLLGQDEQKRVKNAYGNNYQKLREIKKKWDPDNIFRQNHNIEPSGK